MRYEVDRHVDGASTIVRARDLRNARMMAIAHRFLKGGAVGRLVTHRANDALTT